jgi:hypothetical protein
MKFILPLSALISQASCFSRNQTVSEWGISFTYNTHLVDWDIDAEDSGTPVLNGYVYI